MLTGNLTYFCVRVRVFPRVYVNNGGTRPYTLPPATTWTRTYPPRKSPLRHASCRGQESPCGGSVTREIGFTLFQLRPNMVRTWPIVKRPRHTGNELLSQTKGWRWSVSLSHPGLLKVIATAAKIIIVTGDRMLWFFSARKPCKCNDEWRINFFVFLDKHRRDKVFPKLLVILCI